MTTLERQEQVEAYREHPTRAALAMAYHVEQSRMYKHIYIAAALRRAIGEGEIMGLRAELDGREVRLYFTRYGRSEAHHYKAYAKFASDWSPVPTADLHRIVNVTLNK